MQVESIQLFQSFALDKLLFIGLFVSIVWKRRKKEGEFQEGGSWTDPLDQDFEISFTLLLSLVLEQNTCAHNIMGEDDQKRKEEEEKNRQTQGEGEQDPRSTYVPSIDKIIN